MADACHGVRDKALQRTLILKRWRVARQLLPRDVYFWLRALLLALVAVQAARLIWALATPLGPIGQWLPPAPSALPEVAQLALLTSVDPFGRQAALPAGPAPEATGLTLFGTRVSYGGASASAIIAGADGVQNSVAVGDEVAPGVRLLSVGFDFVLVGGNGREQRLAMEGAEPPAGEPAGAAAPTGASGSPAVTAAAIRANIAFAPRTASGRITGLLVSPLGNPAFLTTAGLRDGDVITSVNGRPVSDPATLISQLTPGARISMSVERGASVVPVALLLEGSR